MSVGISALFFFLGQIKKLADLAKTERTEAINALTPAVAQTIAYTTRCEQGRPRDLGIEEKLHELWFEASVKVHPYNKDLSLICREKARYWLKYDEYKEEEIKERNIRLIDIARTLDEMIER
ncbi:MAG: hypothetical protein E7H83_26025 [Enterobacteriaceae bacterium]|jgi:hypothetical protein|nr:hypothetical protein [Enterobacteriaceae bacterium]PTA96353.1 hypothetical protein C9415_05830 [Kluyvera sp. Nf5]